MDCRDFRKSIRGFLEKDLSLGQVLAFEAHHKECPRCEEQLQQSREITCRDTIEFIVDYLEDDLPPAPRLVFERHLQICPECVDYLDTYKKTIVLERGALCDGEDELPAVPEALIQAILKARRAEGES